MKLATMATVSIRMPAPMVATMPVVAMAWFGTAGKPVTMVIVFRTMPVLTTARRLGAVIRLSKQVRLAMTGISMIKMVA